MKLKSILTFALAPILTLGLAACASDPVPSSEALRFNTVPPIQVGVAQVEVIQDYQPKNSPNEVDTLMTIPPAQAVRTWVADRLHADSSTGYLRITIKDASVTRQDLPLTDSAFKQLFTREQTSELAGRIAVEIYGERRDHNFSGYTTVEVTRKISVPEHPSPYEMAKIERKMLEEMMTDFDKKAEQGIRKNLPDLLTP